MGITGLIPFLEKASTRGNINQFSGQTVAIDAYCWLHKGAFSCAEKLALGEPTDQYVTYCMKFVNMLLANKIKPILVFDGCHLPAKKETESKRREQRNMNRKRAAELIRMGQIAEGKNVLRRSIDISHEMALNLIKHCHERNVDCIVAPYEADAQLAYLNISGIANVIITEDSDLTLFGCQKIFFKMDVVGNGLLVEQSRLHLAMGVPREHFDLDKFRYMCILSGCDYLPSLPGIGLSKACKFIKKTSESDMDKALIRLPFYLNMKSLDVTKEYRDAFLRANVTFKHQLVFCPMKRKQVRLTPPPPDVTVEQLKYAGSEMPNDLAWQLAVGNYDPMTLTKMHDYNPDDFVPGKKLKRSNSWNAEPVAKHHSMWSRDYKIIRVENNENEGSTVWPDTIGKKSILNTNNMMHKLTLPKRDYDESIDITEANVVHIYKGEENIAKRPCYETELTPEQTACNSDDQQKSPILNRKVNPFVIDNSQETSPSMLDKGKKRARLRNLTRFRPTILDSSVLTRSKYFAQLNDAAAELTENVAQHDENLSQNMDQSQLETSKNSEVTALKSMENLSPSKDEQNKKSAPNIQYAENETIQCRMETNILHTKQRSFENLNGVEKLSCILDGTTSTTLMEISNTIQVDERSHLSQDLLNMSVPCSNNTSAADYQNTDYDSNPEVTDIKNISKYNLFNWANTKKKDAAAVAAQRSVHNVMQGLKQTNRLTRTNSNKKIQLVKRKSQTDQSQQSLLSSFGFHKKTSLQH